jgi:hypothetical protein
LVKEIVKTATFVSIRFNDRYGSFPADKAYNTAKSDLIDMLHKNRVIWLGVDASLYYSSGPDKLELNSLFPKSGNHAVALVGYQTQGDMFLIKDSNKPGLVRMSANRLLPSLEEAYALK